MTTLEERCEECQSESLGKGGMMQEAPKMHHNGPPFAAILTKSRTFLTKLNSEIRSSRELRSLAPPIASNYL